MMYAESPAEGVAVHRGWDVPKVNHWRRKRNYVLGSTVFFRPSTDLRPLSTPLPPANVARAGPCRSPNCPYFASSVLSNGACTYCCAKCAERPGKHGALCQKHPIAGGAPPPEWELPLHGTVDFELFLHMKIPSEDSHNAASLTAASCCRDLAWLPTLLTTHGPHAASSRVPRLTPHFTPHFAAPHAAPTARTVLLSDCRRYFLLYSPRQSPPSLIPLSFARWVMVKLVRLVYPYLLTLNERFHQTPFSARVQEDAHGFYRRCAAAFAERSRPCNAERCNAVGGNEGEATGGCGGGSGGSTTGAGATQWAGPFVFNVPAS